MKLLSQKEVFELRTVVEPRCVPYVFRPEMTKGPLCPFCLLELTDRNSFINEVINC